MRQADRGGRKHRRDRPDSADRPQLIWINQFSVPPEQPGGTRHFDMGSELARRGWDVTLVASDLNLGTRTYCRRRGARDHRAIDERSHGLTWLWLNAGSYRVNDWRRVTSMLAFGGHVVWSLLRRPTGRRTVIIGSSPHLFAALGAWVVAALRRRPFVLEIRDLWPESFTEVSGRSRGPDVTAMRWIADFLYRRAAVIVVLAEANLEIIAARGVEPGRIVFVPNGVDVETWGESSGAPAIRLGEDGATVFVYAGAHGPANGLDVVIDACALLEARGRGDVGVALVGDGPVKEWLVRRAEELGIRNVTFYDPVPKSEIAAVLGSADGGLMVLADAELFRYGVSPNKLFDYMAAGLPVVTNVPGLVSDIVSAACCGVAVPPADAVALADAMERLADDCDPTWGPSGRSYVEENYDRRKLAERLDTILTSLLPEG